MIALVLAVAQQPHVMDFYPLMAGTKARFTHSIDGQIVKTMDEVLPMGTFENTEKQKVEAIPIKLWVNGRAQSSSFYKADETTVWYLGSKPDKLDANPRPIFRIGAGKVKWEWTGLEEDQLPLTLKFESEPKGRRNVLGRDVDVYELRLDATHGPTTSPAKIKQTALYGRGIGLFELKEERKTKRTTEKRSVSLDSIEVPGSFFR